MKIILWALVIATMLLSCSYAQESEKVIAPIVSSATIDSVAIDSGSAVITAPSGSFTGITAGDYLYGLGIAYGTTVSTISNDTITMSASAAKTTALASINASLYSATAYSSGDWMGYPFLLFSSSGVGGIMTLNSLVISDSSDQLGNTDLILFSAYSDSLDLDNAAIAVQAGDYSIVLGYVSLTSAIDLGDVKVLTKDGINLSLPKGVAIYGRLIAKSTPTFTGTGVLKIRFRFLP